MAAYPKSGSLSIKYLIKKERNVGTFSSFFLIEDIILQKKTV